MKVYCAFQKHFSTRFSLHPLPPPVVAPIPSCARETCWMTIIGSRLFSMSWRSIHSSDNKPTPRLWLGGRLKCWGRRRSHLMIAHSSTSTISSSVLFFPLSVPSPIAASASFCVYGSSFRSFTRLLCGLPFLCPAKLISDSNHLLHSTQ